MLKGPLNGLIEKQGNEMITLKVVAVVGEDERIEQKPNAVANSVVKLLFQFIIIHSLNRQAA